MTPTSSVSEQQTYYDNFWATYSRKLNPAEILRLSHILAAMSLVCEDARLTKKELDICDFGSGWGWLSNDLSRFGKVLGVELSEDAVSRSQRDFPHVEFVSADITTWKPGRRFNTVVSSEVLEHVPDKKAFFRTISEILSPGGWLILSTPNRTVQKEWFSSGGVPQLIEDWCSTSELRQLAHGFEIIDHYTFLFDFCYRGKFRWLSAPKFHRFLKSVRLFNAYNNLRSAADLGLYQIIIARKKSR